MTVTIRRCTVADVPELARVSRIAFADTFGPYNSAANIERYLERTYNEANLTREIIDPENRFYFLQQDDAVAGYLKVSWGQAQSEPMGDDRLELARIYVLPAYKRQGFGGQLMQQALAVAQERHVGTLWLGVWEHNDPARAFYARNGFTPTGTHTFMMGDKPQTDCIYMRDLQLA